MRLLRDACKRGVAGVIVTHDAQLASWADRVVFLRDGRVVDQTAAPPSPSRCSRPARRGDRRQRRRGGPRAPFCGGRCGCSAASGASRSSS